jgi:periplasmic protein TonB
LIRAALKKNKRLAAAVSVHFSAGMKPRAALVSLALHFFGALALFLVASFVPMPMLQRPLANIPIAVRAPRIVMAKPTGGGDRSLLPANRGRAREVHVRKIFMPPVAVIRNENPKLIVEQALLNAPEINISAENIGDPLGVGRVPSGGPGGPLGIGPGIGYSIGPGKGSGGDGGSSGQRARLSRQPQLIYKVEPEYSEDARKVHFQGTVVLAIEVDSNGTPSNIRVVRSLGLGLDERAIQAVAKWKFRPAMSGDHAVAAPATVEVTFHLL